MEESAGRCLLQSDIDSLDEYNGLRLDEIEQQVEFNQLDISGGRTTETQVNSDLISYYYYNATLGCLQFDDPNSCQLLANLCVIQMYNEDTKVCAALLQKMAKNTELANEQYNFNGYKAFSPWIYYKETSLSIFDQNRIKMRVSFDNNEPKF